MVNLPVPVSEIQTFMPHRGRAIWIDEVLAVSDNDGRCKIIFKSDAHYVTDGTIRPSSYIEWMGQAYGYIMSCQALMAGLTAAQLKRAYLVGVRDVEITELNFKPNDGDEIFVEVKKTHEMGPLILIQGRVLTADGKVLAHGQVKIFAQG